MITVMIFMMSIWLLAAPMGYVVGDVWTEMKGKENDFLPVVCALLPPVGAAVAVMILLEVEYGD